MLSLNKHHLSHSFTVAAIVFCFALDGSITLKSQSWTPAGQMVGPLMWEFPLSIPDGTHIIPLRWVNKRNNDSLYWFDIKSFSTTPKAYEKQTTGLRTIEEVGDFDGNGATDIIGRRLSSPSSYFIFNTFTTEQREFTFDTTIHVPNLQDEVAYVGDIDIDGFDDVWRSSIVVYGDRENPFRYGSYVEIHDNKNPQYPDLEPTYVAAVGMLGGKPCVVQMYPRWPGFYTYELVELNLDDLRQRKPRIRTNLLAKMEQPGAAYGLVVLRTPNVWWLFDTNNDDNTKGRGMKVTPSTISLEPVSDFWRGGWQQYFGQGGKSGDENFPRVMDGDRPFIREGYKVSEVENGESVRHAVFALARLVDAESATVEIIGSGYPHKSQYREAYATNAVVVPDVDNDKIDEFMVTLSYWDAITKQYQNSVSLYLTTERPTVSVGETADDTTTLVVDQGESWRVIGGVTCTNELVETAEIYEVSGAVVASVNLRVNGSDLILEKPRSVSHQALWLRLGTCTLRLP